jgi:hypothetical protein
MKLRLPRYADPILFYLEEAGAFPVAVIANEVRKRVLEHELRGEFEHEFEASVYALVEHGFAYLEPQHAFEVHFAAPKFQPRYRIFGALLTLDESEDLYKYTDELLESPVDLVITQRGLETQR